MRYHFGAQHTATTTDAIPQSLNSPFPPLACLLPFILPILLFPVSPIPSPRPPSSTTTSLPLRPPTARKIGALVHSHSIVLSRTRRRPSFPALPTHPSWPRPPLRNGDSDLRHTSLGSTPPVAPISIVSPLDLSPSFRRRHDHPSRSRKGSPALCRVVHPVPRPSSFRIVRRSRRARGGPPPQWQLRLSIRR